MAATLEVESTLTDRYQTTVPETVRRALKLGKRDKIRYSIRPDGEVVMTRATEPRVMTRCWGNSWAFWRATSPTIPSGCKPSMRDWCSIQSLVGHAEVDLDAPLSADDE